MAKKSRVTFIIEKQMKNLLDFLIQTDLSSEEIIEVSSMVDSEEKALMTLERLQKDQEKGRIITRELALLETIQ